MKYFLFFPGITVLLWLGCVDPASSVQVNAKFNDHPPQHNTPKMTQVHSNVYKVEIRMDKVEIGSVYYAVIAKGSKWVFRDDGKSGDFEYGDGVYTVFYTDHGECLKEINENLIEFHNALALKQTMYKCIDGLAIPVNKQEILDFERSWRFRRSLTGIPIPKDLANIPFCFSGEYEYNDYKVKKDFSYDIPVIKSSID